MVRLARGDSRCRPKWRSVDKHDAESQEFLLLADTTTWILPPTQTSTTSQGTYINSFICHDDYLYIFQFVVSGAHDIKDALVAQFAKWHGLPPCSNWRFLCIVPDDVKEIESPYSRNRKVQERTPFPSHVVMTNFAKPVASLKRGSRQSIKEGEEREG